jgi:MGT family glycosyltransferase
MSHGNGMPTKRFLFVIVEGGGNVPAQISIARRLKLRGHDVHVLGDPAVEPEAVSAGCSFLPFVHAPRHNIRDQEADVIRDWEPSSPIAQMRRVGEHLMFGPSAAYAHDVLETVDRVRPDALAVDCLPFGAIMGAEKSGVPSAVLVHFPIHGPVRGATPFGLGLRRARGPLGRLRDRILLAAMRRLFAFGLKPVNAARQRLGLEPLLHVLEQLMKLPRALILTSREFDFVPEGLASNVRYVGPQLDDPEWPEPWDAATLGSCRDPLVVVSLGSTYQRQEKAFAAILQALGTLPVCGLATYGAMEPPTAPPQNVITMPSAPHAAVLPLASAVVCHGGHGTVMKAFARGLPVVVMPFGRDQKDNAARVEACGAGLRVPASARPARITRAIRRVLDEPAFRERAEHMAAIIARDVQEDRAVAELEALALCPPTRGSAAAQGTMRRGRRVADEIDPAPVNH